MLAIGSGAEEGGGEQLVSALDSISRDILRVVLRVAIVCCVLIVVLTQAALYCVRGGVVFLIEVVALGLSFRKAVLS